MARRAPWRKLGRHLAVLGGLSNWQDRLSIGRPARLRDLARALVAAAKQLRPVPPETHRISRWRGARRGASWADILPCSAACRTGRIG